jgi:ABC-type phosphate transport system permease subunit
VIQDICIPSDRKILAGWPEVDVYGRWGLDFMRPLMEDMVKADPTQRPTIDEVVARFADI